MIDLANRDDGNGEYLFAGTSTGTEPFALGTTGVNYQGDLTNRQIRISSSQSLADGHTGAEVFMDIPERNGVFTHDVTAGNTGSGTIDVGRVSRSRGLGCRQLHTAVHQRHRLAGGGRHAADAQCDRQRHGLQLAGRASAFSASP